MLDIRFLGQYSVTLDGQPVELHGRPAQVLLAWLVLNAGRPQPRESLADRLWPESSAANGRANLRHALWQIRAAVDHDYFLSDAHALTFNRASDYVLDVDSLTRARPASTLAELLAAAAAYKGELLPGFYEPWVVQERERLAAVHEQRMADLLERLVAGEKWADVLNWAERWIALGETPEPAYRALMQAYAARGDTGMVMATYHRCQVALRNQLGVEPSAETRRLAGRSHLPATAVSGPSPLSPATSEPAIDQAGLVEFERQRAELYRRLARRSNRLALGALLALAAAVGGMVASRRR